MTQLRKFAGEGKPRAKRGKREIAREAAEWDEPQPATQPQDDYSGLSYVKLRTKAKELGISAKGKAAEILERIAAG